MKKLKTYSQHKYHYDKLDDLLDEVLSILDEFGIVEYKEEYSLSDEGSPPNWCFTYGKSWSMERNAIYSPNETHDGVLISSINSFKAGQEMLKKLAELAPKIERAIGCDIGVQTSKLISTPDKISDYKRTNDKYGHDDHPYIEIVLDPGSNFKGIKYV